MNKIQKAYDVIDKKIEKRVGFLRSFFKKYFPVISTMTLILFVLIFAIRIFYSRPSIIASLIEDDIKIITLALEKIDAECNILGIEDDHNEVDFLNVKSFSGSQVGSLSLAYPKKWAGPYLNVNPTIQDKFYEIVKAKDGIFVMPGKGVLLPNGLVVGKDFYAGIGVNIAGLLRKGGPLTYEGKKFAMKLMFKVGDWDPWLMRKSSVEEFDRMLQEFGEAMPFAYNNTTCDRNYV